MQARPSAGLVNADTTAFVNLLRDTVLTSIVCTDLCSYLGMRTGVRGVFLKHACNLGGPKMEDVGSLSLLLLELLFSILISLAMRSISVLKSSNQLNCKQGFLRYVWHQTAIHVYCRATGPGSSGWKDKEQL